MGWRFRKYITIFPGVRLNISKSGVSLTFGTKGASVSVSEDGAYLNTSIPGTGMYNRQKIYSSKDDKGCKPVSHQDSSSDEKINNSTNFTDPCKKRSISTHPKRGYPFTFLISSS